MSTPYELNYKRFFKNSLPGQWDRNSTRNFGHGTGQLLETSRVNVALSVMKRFALCVTAVFLTQQPTFTVQSSGGHFGRLRPVWPQKRNSMSLDVQPNKKENQQGLHNQRHQRRVNLIGPKKNSICVSIP